MAKQNAASINASNPLSLEAGGLGADLSASQNKVLVTNAGSFTEVQLGDGQVLLGATAGAPIAASLTAGSNVTLTPGPNSLEIAAAGPNLPSVTITTGTATLSYNTKHYINVLGPTTLSLPAAGSGTVGDIIEIVGIADQGYVIQLASGESLWFAELQATPSTGTISADNIHNCLKLEFFTGGVWTVSSSTGSFTLS